MLTSAIWHLSFYPFMQALARNRVCFLLEAAPGDLAACEWVGWKRSEPGRQIRRRMSPRPDDGRTAQWTAEVEFPEEAHYIRYGFWLEDASGRRAWLNARGAQTDFTGTGNFEMLQINGTDVIAVPGWAQGCVYYQIFPERFARHGQGGAFAPWDAAPTRENFLGGSLRGIINRLTYLTELGVECLYLNPIFAADSVHRYDTRDYTRVDPELGTNADLKQLVEQAHTRGIRVMLDAVFNHCGPHFAPWRDVMEKGPDSPYWDWFMVNRWPPEAAPGGTRDGRYFSFAFAADMPKLNTNNPAVIDYFGTLCESWVRDYGVDGIRFDVGNEISHRMLKELRRRVRAIRPDVYLLGEIWHDASPWLEGDEYDAVMNYPLQQAVKDFFADSARTAGELAEQLYRCLHLYRCQTTEVLFNLMDSHDTDRLFTRSGSEDAFFQQLALLFTLPGSPCIYYGTEVALPGGHDPDCRRCMPWDKMNTTENQQRIDQLRRLIALRRTLPELRDGMPVFRQAPGARQVWYCRGRVEVLLNAGNTPWELCPEKEILFARGLTGNRLAPGGICIRR